MGDPKSIFRSLTTGITFDKKRFRSEAEKFGITGKKIQTDAPKVFITLEDRPRDPDPSDLEPQTPSSSSEEEENELTLLGDISVKRKKRSKSKSKDRPSKSKLLKVHTQNVNRFRNLNRIHVFGSDIPDPIDGWQKLETRFNVSENLLSKVNSRFEHPTPVQMQAVPLMLEKRQLLVCAPTGSGKTAAYLVPLVHLLSQEVTADKKKPISAVIVSPTRELAIQIHRECSLLCENTKLRPFVIDKVNRGIKKLSSGQYDIIVTTPNRLVYMLKQEPAVISLKNVEYLVIDESDKLFEAGERGFRDQLAVIYRACAASSSVCCAMFSATMAPDVEQWCKLNLDNPVTVTIGERNRATETVRQRLVYTTEKSKFQAIKDLVAQGIKPPVLVFVQSKTRAKELYDELAKDKSIKVDVIHSDRSELQRDQTVKAFRAGRVWILICTELLGRGIDFKGVNLVINYDFPTTSHSYIHRIGRTGRAGRGGEAVTFFTQKDTTLLRSIAQIIKNSGGEVPEYMLKLKKATRQEKRYLAKHEIKRETISRESKYDREKREKLQLAIAKSKRCKLAEYENKENQNVETEETEIEEGPKKSKKRISEKKREKIKNKLVSVKVSKKSKKLSEKPKKKKLIKKSEKF